MKNEIKVILTADIKALQSALVKAQKSLQDFEAKNAAETEKSNQTKKRQLGIIEKLNKEAEKLKISLTRATNKEDIAKFNQQLEQTKKKLSDLNALGKSSSNPVGLINNLNAEAKKLKDAIALATDEKTVARLNAELKRTQQELIRINSLGKSIAAPAVKSFDNLKRSAGAASGAAISFGRIIQDAPFGIIGVANNIQNFGEQFAALGGKATTAGQKLSMFFSALIAPANLAILAVSALTAAYQAYSLGLFDAEEETKDLRTESEKLNDSLDTFKKNLSDVDNARLKGNQSAVDELVKVKLLKSAIEDKNKTDKERIKAFDILKSLYPSIIGSMTSEQAIAKGLGTAYDKINQSIRDRAKAQGIYEVLLEVEKENAELQLKTIKETLYKNKLLADQAKLQKEVADFQDLVNRKNARGNTTQSAFNESLRKAQTELASVNAELKLLNEVVSPSTTKALEENKFAANQLESQFNATTDAVENFNDNPVDPKISRSFEDLTFLGNFDKFLDDKKLTKFNFQLANFFETSKETIRGLVGPVQGSSMIYTENVEAMIQKNKEFEEALNSIGLTSAQVFQAIANGAAEGYSSFNEFITDLATTQQFFNEAFAVLEAGIENTIGDVAFSIGEALGSGGDALRSGGGALLGGMAVILNQLGQLAIQAGITIEATKQSLKTLNGPIAIAAGIAMVALAGYLSSQSKSLAGKFGGGSSSPGSGSTFTNRREFGGPVSKGRAYIVGERRPELFVPNTNGVIIPQLPSMDYSSASVSSAMYGVEVMLKGPDDLLFFVEQAQIRRNIR
jgi:hypothetical protein